MTVRTFTTGSFKSTTTNGGGVRQMQTTDRVTVPPAVTTYRYTGTHSLHVGSPPQTGQLWPRRGA